MVPEQIEREIVIDAPVARVWSALTEAEQIGAWFGDAGADVDLRPGGALVLRWKEYGAVPGAIEQVEPQHFLSWRWLLGEGPELRPDNSTLVEFSLTPEGDGTRLRVVESGFRQLAISEEEQARRAEENTGGWQAELADLQNYLQRVAA
jgi:uncharacterized protein YndB with AHSA1/START domain